jgi:hypothetical protein
MNKEDFYYSDGVPFHGIFREIPMSGQWIKGEPKVPLYTIKDDDDDLPSARKIYMDSVNEYDAALRLTPSWSYWKHMVEHCVKIKRVIEEWREEKYQKDQAQARKLLWEAAQKGNVSAQRIIYEARKEEKEQKEREKRELHQSQKETDLLQDRLSRLTELKLAK